MQQHFRTEWVLLEVVCGLLGGMLAHHVWTGHPLGAQAGTAPQKKIRAEKFELIGADGEVRAELKEIP